MCSSKLKKGIKINPSITVKNQPAIRKQNAYKRNFHANILLILFLLSITNQTTPRPRMSITTSFVNIIR
jgi:hypothetical protein